VGETHVSLPGIRNSQYNFWMNISLPKEHLEWLEAEVAAGHFASIDEALAIAVADLRALSQDDLAWAKPYIDKARASVARGDVISGEEFFKRLNTKINELNSG
jgi:antitoxin ParD1/3/4